MTGFPRPDPAAGDRRTSGHLTRPPDAPVPDGPSLLPPDADLPAGSRAFLDKLLRIQLVGPSQVGMFLRESTRRPDQVANVDALGNALVQAGVLTPYQLTRIEAGTTHGLLLGNHRVLERLGSGSMGVVFLAEHTLLKRRVAIKVLPVDDNLPPALLERFYSEMRILADLHHANIVTAFDAGRLPPPHPGAPALHYLVMELVGGGDLEQHVIDQGILTIAQACHWIRLAAAGLQEAHDHHLIHRDVKPSNMLLTGDGQIKLVDFGLARHFCSQITDPTCLLGSLEFMAPEQSLDASAVDGRADVYGLGASLFWVLAGQPPFPEEKSVARALRSLQCDRPRRLREFRPDVAPELDALIDRMMERDPAQRPALPITVMNALTRFTAAAGSPYTIYEAAPVAEGHVPVATPADKAWKVLIVHDDPATRKAVRGVLEPLGCVTSEAADGQSVVGMSRDRPCDLLLLKQHLPDGTGSDACRQLRDHPPSRYLKIVLMTERRDRTDLADALACGADDCMALPLDLRHLAAKAQHLLRLKDAQDRADLLSRHLLTANRQLEDSLQARAGDVRQAHDALLFAMAKMAEQREGETAAHCLRMQKYCRIVGDHLTTVPRWSGIASAQFLDMVVRCVPLHDIGKLGLPDALLAKPGPLDPSERALMETHTLIGASMLDALGREYGDSLAFLGSATVIVRYHHERYDGGGYPDGLCGDAIPPAARIVALADVYDALRRKRFHKAAFSHDEAVRCLLERCEGQFDPGVLEAFAAVEEQFKKVYHQVRD